VRALLRGLDTLLSRAYGVFVFSEDPQCILRLSLGSAPRPLLLPGVLFERGDSVLFIHLWNERLPAIPPQGPDLAWGAKMLHCFRHSLIAVAGYMVQNPELCKVRAVGGVSSLPFGGVHASGGRLMQALGFTIIPYRNPLGAFGEFWENFYAWLLIWTYNPGSLPYRRFWRMRRSEFWAAADDLLARYGPERDRLAHAPELQAAIAAGGSQPGAVGRDSQGED
jgi:hypothetical protein